LTLILCQLINCVIFFIIYDRSIFQNTMNILMIIIYIIHNYILIILKTIYLRFILIEVLTQNRFKISNFMFYSNSFVLLVLLWYLLIRTYLEYPCLLFLSPLHILWWQLTVLDHWTSLFWFLFIIFIPSKTDFYEIRLHFIIIEIIIWIIIVMIWIN